MFEVNGMRVELPRRLRDASLLDVIRDHVGLRGTKYGCELGLCGACTVHVDGQAVRSCQIRAGGVEGRSITTIEGLALDGEGGRLHPVQEAWIAESVPQCGYCQAGQIWWPRPCSQSIPVHAGLKRAGADRLASVCGRTLQRSH